VKFASFRTFSLKVQLKEGKEIWKAFEKCELKLAGGTKYCSQLCTQGFGALLLRVPCSRNVSVRRVNNTLKKQRGKEHESGARSTKPYFPLL
jgi:hypothetical protein